MSALLVNQVILCEVHSSILDVATIFGNQIRLFLWDSSGITMELNLFHGIHMDCSMESKVDMPAFHMECSGIHVESMMSME